MASRTLVTFGSDGFRDWVALPDGRTFNLGSVSILNLVAGLARSAREARRALDLFLVNKEATLAVVLEDLQSLIAPKRARWATLEKTLIHLHPLMDQETRTAFQSRLSFVETSLHHLSSGVEKAADTAPHILDNVRELLAMVSPGPSKTAAAAYDEDMLRELEVYLDNEMSLQAQRRAILKKLLKSGEYDAKGAPKAFEAWVEDGAKSYSREFDEDPKKFSKELVKDLAEKMSKSHKKAVSEGAYDHLKSVSTSDPEQAKAASVDPSEEGALINEGIAHAILAKIKVAHGAVIKSNSKFASTANSDLSQIASSLASLLDTSDIADPSDRLALLDLSKKADHVLAHFVR